MAAGSHDENGIWALLVMAPVNKRKVEMLVKFIKLLVSNPPLVARKNIVHRNIESPSRFVKIVRIPEVILFGLS